MTTPETTIDRRYSDPAAEPTSWAETERLLREAQLAWLTTVRADGRPHVTPLVTVWVDDALFFTTGPGEQKHLNLSTNPNVAEVFRVTPAKVFAFAKGTFGQTRHRFR